MRFPFPFGAFETVHIQAILVALRICHRVFQATAFFFQFRHFDLPRIFESVI
jgi:hypothetical protein